MKILIIFTIFTLLSLSVTATQAQVMFMPAMQGVHYRPASSTVVVQTQSLSISSGTPVEVVVNITADAGTTIAERGVCWSKNPDPVITDSKLAYGTPALGTATSKVTNMETGNIYYVRGYATVGGITYYGNVMPMAIFYATGSEQTITIPAGVSSATIKVLGARGGHSVLSGNQAYGGSGASIKGTFAVTSGESLYIIVGKKGGDGEAAILRGGGGGGGTFVYRMVSGAKSPMIIAGGGGGGYAASTTQKPYGEPGQLGNDGTSGISATSGIAVTGKGTNGSGGVGNKGGGGAGWNSVGTCTGGQDIGGKRDPWLPANAPTGYGRGGYGGGGSAWQNTSGGAGGGGGYSGGGACGYVSSETVGSGGGGGSYNAAPLATQASALSANSYDGVAIITW